MPGALKIREKAIKKGEIQEESKELEEIRKQGFIGFLKATLMLLKNKYLVLVLLAMNILALDASNTSTKYLYYWHRALRCSLRLEYLLSSPNI